MYPHISTVANTYITAKMFVLTSLRHYRTICLIVIVNDLFAKLTTILDFEPYKICYH